MKTKAEKRRRESLHMRTEDLGREVQINKLNTYNNSVFPIKESLSGEEYAFILNSIKMSTAEDFIHHDHISNYTYCVRVNRDGENKGRFAFGNKTKPIMFKEICQPVFEALSIKHTEKNGFNYYGIGWDVQENIIKIYELSKDFSSIFCIE